ncbi:MAG: 50S ribosomal protein L9 [Bacteriovoracia bacterium]
MKVILLQNVPKVGQKGEIKDVSEGYARNFLLPRKLVKFASPAEVKSLQQQNKKKQEKDATIQKEAKDRLVKISGSKISIKEPANEKGHLFAQVHLKEIADAISSQLGEEISEDWINLTNPIKEVGEFDIDLEAYGKKVQVKLFIEGK